MYEKMYMKTYENMYENVLEICVRRDECRNALKSSEDDEEGQVPKSSICGISIIFDEQSKNRLYPKLIFSYVLGGIHLF